MNALLALLFPVAFTIHLLEGDKVVGAQAYSILWKKYMHKHIIRKPKWESFLADPDRVTVL
jgi:hypothetical protein